MTNPLTFTGSCLCGRIKYAVNKIESQMAHCHCSMCRKFHGAAFATYGEARKENFRWLCGEEHLKSYTAENSTIRLFCEKCGSSLIFVPAGNSTGFVEFALGTLDSKITLQPDAHIYFASKANWLEVNDHLPKHPQGRDSKPIT